MCLQLYRATVPARVAVPPTPVTCRGHLADAAREAHPHRQTASGRPARALDMWEPPPTSWKHTRTWRCQGAISSERMKTTPHPVMKHTQHVRAGFHIGPGYDIT